MAEYLMEIRDLHARVEGEDTDILRGVITDGTGTRAALEDRPVAGKTGTTDKFNVETGVYSETETIAWFIGIAPVDDPEIVVAVFVFNGGEGSAWAAPVACHVMASYFGLAQYASDITRGEWEEALLEDNRACNSRLYNPVIEPTSFAPESIAPAARLESPVRFCTDRTGPAALRGSSGF